MASQNINNYGEYRSDGNQLIGNSFNTNGGHINFYPPAAPTRNDDSFQLGLHFGEAPVIDPSLFVGRSSELHTIRQVLETSLQEQRRLVLGGLGGIGKTQLVIAYIRQYRDSYGSIFWLDATSNISLHNNLRLVAGQFVDGEALDKLSDQQVSSRVQTWLSHPKNPRWLLVFDNYDEPDRYDISKYYPPAAHGSIIVTTRVPDLMRFPAHRIRLQSLNTIAEGLDILQKRSGREDVQDDPYARRLAERLAGLPLALASAGAYLNQSTSMSFRRYLKLHEQSWNIDPERPLQLQEYRDRTLYTTWNLSYTQLERNDPDAAILLKLLAYFDNRQLWYSLISAGDRRLLSRTDRTSKSMILIQRSLRDRISFDSTMRTLAQYCFVEIETATRSYSVHHCVHAWITEELNKTVDSQLYYYTMSCIAKALRVKPHDYAMFFGLQYAVFVPHAARLSYHGFTRNGQLGQIPADHEDDYCNIAALLRQQSQVLLAERMFLQVLDAREKRVGLHHGLTLHTLSSLGLLYLDQGRVEEAEKILVRALRETEKLFGPSDKPTLQTMELLGLTYLTQNRLPEAEGLFRKILKVTDQSQECNSMLTFLTVRNIGNIYYVQKRWLEAEKMFHRALAGFEKLHNQGLAQVPYVAAQLGVTYTKQGKLDEAEDMFLKALDHYKSMRGLQYPETLLAAKNLAKIYRAQGRDEKAVGIEERYEVVAEKDSHIGM